MVESRGNSGVNRRVWIFNKPSPPWIGSCSMREAEDFGVCGYGRPPLRQTWASVYVANPFQSGIRSGISGNLWFEGEEMCGGEDKRE